MGTATEDEIDTWLREIGMDSLERVDESNWNFKKVIGDRTLQINIMFAKADPPKPSMIGVGCLFLNPPEKNQFQLYERLLELHTVSHETKFCLVKNGSIMLITHRSAVDLDPSELKEMINTVAQIYDQFHDNCVSIVS